jgi:adenylate cyclase
MRAATWANHRDIHAARTSWQRARSVADALPDDDPDQLSMRIAPRAMLCSTAWRVGGDLADSGFDELRELCIEASDKPSLTIAMAGQLLVLATHARYRESSRLAVEFAQLLESIDDPTIIIRALPQVMVAKYEAGAMAEALQLSQRVIDLVDSDPSEGSLDYRTALARATMMRGLTLCCLGRPGWKTDLDDLDGKRPRPDIARPRDHVRMRHHRRQRGGAGRCGRNALHRGGFGDRRAIQ